MIISLMGTDGTGKTTLCTSLISKLRSSGLPVRYKRGYDYLFLNFVLSLFTENVENVREFFLTRQLRKPGYFRLWPYLVWLDALATYVMDKLFKQKEIVIYDRYVHDFIIGWEYFGYSNKLLRHLYYRFPLPEIALILDAPAEVTFKRSKYDHKYPYEFYYVQRLRYQNLARLLHITTIDATAERENVVTVALQFIEPQLQKFLALLGRPEVSRAQVNC